VSLNESIVEAAALAWSCLRASTHRQIRLRQGFRRRRAFGGQDGGQVGEQTRVARTLTPALSHGEREEDGEAGTESRLEEAT